MVDLSNIVARITEDPSKGKGKTGETETEYLRAHIVGSETGETKLILDINTDLLPQDKVTALQGDFDFIFSSYEI